MTEREEIAQTIREEIKAELAKALSAEVPNPQTQNKPEPLSINIGGQIYQFDTKEQMEAALTQTFSTFRDQLEKAKTPAETKGAYVSGKENEPVFDQNTYVDLMGKDVLAAQKYALDHVFGVPDSANFIKNSLAESQNLKATVAVYQFRELHPEFPMTADATKVVDGIRRELNQPFSLQGLEAAYGVAQSRGLIPSPQLLAYQQDLISKGILPDPQNQTQQTTQQQNQQQRPNPAQNSPYGFQPPPGVGRSAQEQNGDLAAAAENMTLEQLTAALKRAGQL